MCYRCEACGKELNVYLDNPVDADEISIKGATDEGFYTRPHKDDGAG